MTFKSTKHSTVLSPNDADGNPLPTYDNEEADEVKKSIDELEDDEEKLQGLIFDDGKQSRLLQEEEEKEFEEAEKENEERLKELEGTDIEETHEEYLQKHKDDPILTPPPETDENYYRKYKEGTESLPDDFEDESV